MPAGPRAGPPGRALRKAPPARRAGLFGAPERAATRPGPADGGSAQATRLHGKKSPKSEGEGVAPSPPAGKTPGPEAPLSAEPGRDARVAAPFSDFGDFLP